MVGLVLEWVFSQHLVLCIVNAKCSANSTEIIYSRTLQNPATTFPDVTFFRSLHLASDPVRSPAETSLSVVFAQFCFPGFHVALHTPWVYQKRAERRTSRECRTWSRNASHHYTCAGSSVTRNLPWSAFRVRGVLAPYLSTCILKAVAIRCRRHSCMSKRASNTGARSTETSALTSLHGCWPPFTLCKTTKLSFRELRCNRLSYFSSSSPVLLRSATESCFLCLPEATSSIDQDNNVEASLYVAWALASPALRPHV